MSIEKLQKELFCRHSYVRAVKPYDVSFEFRVCTKCNKSQVGGYASLDGRFYWVGYGSQLIREGGE